MTGNDQQDGKKNGTLLRWTVAATCVCAAALLAATAAPPLQGLEFGQRWWKNPEVVERLHLTRDQVEAIDRIAYDAADRMIDLRAEKQRAEMMLLRLLGGESLDDQELDRALKQLEAAECGLRSLELRARVDIARLLDHEQRVAVQRRFERARQHRNRARPAPRRDR